MSFYGTFFCGWLCLLPNISQSLFALPEWLQLKGKQTETNTCQGKPSTINYTPSYELEAFLDMRQASETYEMFFSYFIPATGCRTYWKHMVANAKTDDDITTVSKEVFVVLILENNWKRWLEIY